MLISGAIYDHLPGKVTVPIVGAGTLRIEGVAKEVQTYKVRTRQKAKPPSRAVEKRHSRMALVLGSLLVIVLLIVFAGGAAFYLGMQRFSRPGPLDGQTTVLIEKGSSLSAISEQLSSHNVIDSPLVFELAARMRDLEDRLQAGEYLFETAVSMQQVLDNLVSGRSVLHAILLPEGLTSQTVIDRLMADQVLTGEIETVPPEGALMPAKYQFTRGATRQQLIDQMQQAQARLVEEAWARRAPGLPIDTVEEFVTLASIVEKETGRADERPRVASVFINRLEQGMRLQSDPTVIYGIYGGAGKPPDHEILQSELDRQTPYNTYQIAGLPPGPIANPGRAALEAVANPSRTDELYFVADGSGGHAFATTLDEHNRNVERYRQMQALERPQTEHPAAAAAEESVPAAEDADASEQAEVAAVSEDESTDGIDAVHAGEAEGVFNEGAPEIEQKILAFHGRLTLRNLIAGAGISMKQADEILDTLEAEFPLKFDGSQEHGLGLAEDGVGGRELLRISLYEQGAERATLVLSDAGDYIPIDPNSAPEWSTPQAEGTPAASAEDDSASELSTASDGQLGAEEDTAANVDNIPLLPASSIMDAEIIRGADRETLQSKLLEEGASPVQAQSILTGLESAFVAPFDGSKDVRLGLPSLESGVWQPVTIELRDNGVILATMFLSDDGEYVLVASRVAGQRVGAVAVNKNGEFYYSGAYWSWTEARKQALERCGSRECRAFLHLQDGCIAVYGSKDSPYSISWGDSIDESQQASMAVCLARSPAESCDLNFTACP